MMKREGSVRTLEIIKECADTAGGCKISLEQEEKAMEIEQLERIADALEGISGHLSRLTSCIGSSVLHRWGRSAGQGIVNTE